MHKKNALVTLFALAVPALATAHPGHAGHTHGEDFAAGAVDALAGSGHPKVLLMATVLAAGVLIVAAGALRSRTPACSRSGLPRQRA